jgi:hypothetical protein
LTSFKLYIKVVISEDLESCYYMQTGLVKKYIA